MLYLPYKALQKGMTLAKNVSISMAMPICALAGDTITDEILQKFKEYGIPGAYIENEAAKDIIIGATLKEKNDEQALQCLQEIYTEDISMLNKNIGELADKLVSEALEENHLISGMFELQTYDKYTYRHCLRVGLLCTYIGIALRLDEHDLRQLTIAGLLHDLGKTQLDPDLLNKPTRYTHEEYEQITQHSSLGFELAKKAGCSNLVLGGIKYHHERFDGDGYPCGLCGRNIPLFARIIAVADVYDALTSKRPYREPNFPDSAARYLMGNCDSQFDKKIVDAFLQIATIYPEGTVVRLSDENVAIVVGTSGDSMHPIVKIIGSENVVNLKETPLLEILNIDYKDDAISKVLGREVNDDNGFAVNVNGGANENK